MQKLFIAILFSFCTVIGLAQSNKDTLHTSQKIKRVNGRVISNQTVGIADTVKALVKGQSFDDNNNGIYAEVVLKNKGSGKQYAVETNDNGAYSIYVPAGQYSLTVEQAGYGAVNIESLALGTGQVQEVMVSLGSRYVIQHVATLPAETLQLKPKRKHRRVPK